MIDTDKYEGHVPPPYVVNEIETFTQNFGGELDKKRTYFREYTIDAPNRKGLKELVRTGIKDYHEKRLKHGLTHSKELVEPYNRPYLSFTNEAEATARLMADAPLLLAEVKRLRKQVEALFSEIRRLEGDDGEWIE
tara:strand:- start:1517 stop:1924 length:408 start_codon:yes stop_codon:yes gene_type:complete